MQIFVIGTVLAPFLQHKPKPWLFRVIKYMRVWDAAGDVGLRCVGEVFRKVLRAAYGATRIGEKELAIIVPSLKPERAGFIAKRTQHPLGMDDVCFPRTNPSMGIACIEITKTWVETFISQSDFAMYDAKSAIENKFVIGEIRNVA